MTRLMLAVLAWLALAPGVHAGDIEADGRITAVTVLRDRALVTREMKLNLPAGDSVVTVRGLPLGLVRDSLRAAGQGGFDIGSVETRRIAGSRLVNPRERELTDRLQTLGDQKQALKDRGRALQRQLAFLDALGKETAAAQNEKLARGSVDPSKWGAAARTLGDESGRVYTEQRQVAVKLRDLEREIAKVKRELGGLRSGRRDTLQARVHLAAAKGGAAVLTLRYQVTGAGWTPGYQARLDSEHGRLTLVQQAQVRQNTGESWDGVPLTLSTAQPARGLAVPELRPWVIDFYTPSPVARMKREAPSKAMDGVAMLAGAPAPAMEAKARLARVEASEFAVEYRVPGTVEVPSDNAWHRFTLTEQRFDATLAARSVPRRTPTAFLHAAFTYDGAAPLLPGRLSLYRDGAFIGNGHLDALRKGEAVKLPFGADERIRVKYEPVPERKSTEGLISKDRRVERHFRITVQNHHGRPMKVTLLDQLPVAANDDIKVELLRPSLPVERDFEKRKGVLAWQRELKPGEKQVLKFGYAVTYPADKRLSGL